MSSVGNGKLIYTYSEKSGHFMCTECKFRTSSFVDICTHFIKNHTVGNLLGKFQCPYCSIFILTGNRKHIANCRVKGKKQESLHLKSSNVSSVSENEDQQFGKQMMKNDIVMSTSDKPLVVRPFHCDICKRDFDLKRLLMNHMKAVHLHGHDSLLSCGLCSADFLQHFSLDVHRSAAHHVTVYDLDKPVVRKRLYLHHLKCHTCSFYAFDRLRLERHSSICNPRGGICHKCKMGFSKRRDLSLHLKYEHSEMHSRHNKHNSVKHVEISRKRSCSKKENHENLKKSGSTSTSQPVEAYEIVEERFKKIDTEISDIIQLGGSFSFSDIVKLTNYALSILYLVDKGTFRCCLCFTEFESPDSVRTHFRKVHLKLFQCHECSFVCRNSLVFKRHCASQHSTYNYYNKNVTFVCDVCGVVFNNENQLAKHMIFEHDKHLILNRPTKFRCNRCDLKFPNLYERRKHYKVHHAVKAKEPHYCAKCGKKCLSKGSLTAHERQVHCPEEDKLKCTICNYKTPSKQKFEQHMRNHTGEKPNACPDCGMRFNQKANMKRHQLTHSREQKYSCPVCGQRFSQGCSMKRHLLTHEKFKPFQCGVCEAVYSQLYPLKQHLKKMHPEVDLEDNIVRLSKALRVSEHQ